MGRIVRAGLLYFLMVGAAGFLVGTIRVLWLLPRLGERWAELLEMPLMLAVVYLGARRVSRRVESTGGRLAAGLLALGLLLAMELGLVLQLRGLTLAEYAETRDPLSGAVYLVSLALFGLAPALLKSAADNPQP